MDEASSVIYVRVPSWLHERIKARAHEEGQSVNQWVWQCLAAAVPGHAGQAFEWSIVEIRTVRGSLWAVRDSSGMTVSTDPDRGQAVQAALNRARQRGIAVSILDKTVSILDTEA